MFKQGDHIEVLVARDPAYHQVGDVLEVSRVNEVKETIRCLDGSGGIVTYGWSDVKPWHGEQDDAAGEESIGSNQDINSLQSTINNLRGLCRDGALALTDRRAADIQMNVPALIDRMREAGAGEITPVVNPDIPALALFSSASGRPDLAGSRLFLHEHGLKDGPMGNSHGYSITNRADDSEEAADDPGYRLVVWEQITEEEGRRLVACWNACAGLDTELLENILMLGDTLKGRFKLLKAELDAGTPAAPWGA